MDDFTNAAELAQLTQKSPVLVIIEQHVLARTCILNILKRELAGFEIVEMATTNGLSWFAGRDIRLIALNIGDRDIVDPTVEFSLAFISEFCPQASVALLSSRDDEATISAAMQRGVRGFFPSLIPLDVAIAGLRLVLAGAVYHPLPIVGQKRSAKPQGDIGTSRRCRTSRTPRRHRHVGAGADAGRPHATRTARARGACSSACPTS